jgi:hypothetical protein
VTNNNRSKIGGFRCGRTPDIPDHQHLQGWKSFHISPAKWTIVPTVTLFTRHLDHPPIPAGKYLRHGTVVPLAAPLATPAPEQNKAPAGRDPVGAI